PPHTSAIRCKLVIWSGKKDDVAKLPSLMRSIAPAAKLGPLTKGGPSHYPEVITRGELGKDDAPYTIDTLTAPEDNPWKSFLRFGGLDFHSNGVAAICSVSG